MVQKNSGSALIYILVAIALIALLTASMMEPSNQQSQAQNETNLVAELQSQISLISSAVDECVLTYPNQDSGLTTTEQKNPPYPINPNDTYFNGVTPGPSTGRTASDIRCPGNPGGANKNHAKIFGGTSGKFLPPAPNLFSSWQYYNGNDGIFIITSATVTDAYISTALQKLDAKYSPCQTEYIDASAGAVTLSSDTPNGSSAQVSCAANSKCFRFWLVRKSTAVPADTTCNN